jgi:hypothetical protein
MAFRYEYDHAWDAGARTAESLAKDGCFTFSVPKSAIGVVCGLNSDDRSATQNEIRYGFLIDKGRYCIIENGVRKTSLTAFPFDNTLFKIERVDGVIRYYTDQATQCI